MLARVTHRGDARRASLRVVADEPIHPPLPLVE
jgi:hypothetical protein